MLNFRKNVLNLLIIALLATAGLMAKGPAADAGTFKSSITSDIITITPDGDYARYDLSVQGPNGFHYSESFSGLEVPFIEMIDPNGLTLADGQYSFRLVAVPVLSDEAREAMDIARQTGDNSAMRAMKNAGSLPQGKITTGNFSVLEGLFVNPNAVEVDLLLDAPIEAIDGRDNGERPGTPTGGDDSTPGDTGSEFDDARAQVFTTDLIVEGSACIGVDCASSESFSFDTIRLKENNLRINFLDTSASASFPGNDWTLVANDSSNGGAERFSVEDATNGRTPFTIEGNTPNNTLYVDSAGRVGIQTNNPVLQLHVVDGNSPALRLEQDGSDGFTPQTWDLSGNEANFFIRDVTNSSKLPFKIKPNAPTNSVFVAASGDVGFGIDNPSERLHIRDTTNAQSIKNEGENPSMVIERTSSTTDDTLIQLDLINNGQVNLRYNNNEGGLNRRWNTGVSDDDSYFVSESGSGGIEIEVMSGGATKIRGGITVGESSVANSGDSTFHGDITADNISGTSDVNMKQDFEPISPEAVLNKVINMPITTWSYKKDAGIQRHMGPMAQDFHAAFGLGKDNRRISYTDSAGVALGAIQGLNELVENMKAQLAAQEARIKELEAQLQK